MLAEIHRAEVRELIEAGAQLIEVLAPGEHEHEHLAGANNLLVGQTRQANKSQSYPSIGLPLIAFKAPNELGWCQLRATRLSRSFRQ